MRNVTFERQRRSARRRSRLALAVVCTLALAVGLSACGAIDDAISFGKYVEGTVDVVEANGMEIEIESDIDCDGSRDTKNVACTGETTEGLGIESTGENLGEADATLVVTVDGEVLFDGLLEDARN